MAAHHVHLLAFDFLSLQPQNPPRPAYLPCTFLRRGRPVSKVEVLGVVVTIDDRKASSSHLRFVLDDGTGCIPCILWLNFFSRRGSRRHGHGRSPDPVHAEVRASIGFAEAACVSLGRLLRVQGRVTSFNQQIQVTVSSLQVERDPNAEVRHWIDCMQLAIKHYDLPANKP